MTFSEAIQHVFNNYANFDGRARRSEYWYFTLFNIIINSILGALAQRFSAFGILASLYSLAVLIPGIAVCTRRLHDTNRSGWFQLLVLIPLVGSIILIIWLAQDSQTGTNQYGPSPKGW